MDYSPYEFPEHTKEIITNIKKSYLSITKANLSK